MVRDKSLEGRSAFNKKTEKNDLQKREDRKKADSLFIVGTNKTTR